MSNFIDYRKYKLLTKLSKKDLRNYRISKITKIDEEFPSVFEIKYNGKIKDQQDIGSCVAHSLAYIKEINEEQEIDAYKMFSTGYIYANREDSDYQEEGMVPKEALRCLLHSGDVLEKDFPYNDFYVRLKDIYKSYNMFGYLDYKASQYKIGGYFTINNIDELKHSLLHYGPVTATFPIYNNFYNISNENYCLNPPKENDNFYGYHQMTILGWRHDYLIVLNSWGEKWGDKGFLYVPFTYPIAEMWGITEQRIDPPNKIIMLLKKILTKIFRLLKIKNF